RPDGTLVDARYRINYKVMRVDLEEPLQPGAVQAFEIDWHHVVPDAGRGAKELVTDGWIYENAQWFPRVSVYDDVNGWQTDQFMGRGEFYLTFGDYDVSITVPWNHIVEATGELQNPQEVLTATQRQRLEQAYGGEEPVFIVRADEVMKPESRPTRSGTLTWRYTAQNVRDFAWASSKTFVWDAAGFKYRPGEPTIKVHSLYPRDAMPLWDKVSTRATVQTLKTYGRLAFEYPYPKAANINGPVGGMEYPMVAYCGARPQPDGTYSERTERALIGVTIHEVGHNWFPMIVATDERKWTWMDEGLNTFLQYYGEIDYAKSYCGGVWSQTADCTYPSATQRGPARNIVEYMRDPDQVPLMTESDLIHKDFGNNGYSKPATGLVMLREHVLGEESFDAAFHFYSQGWMFKHPQPADFFRSMEDGAGENLAWFWRGWFYSTHANDQAIGDVSVQAGRDLVGSDDRGQFYYRIKVDNVGGLVMPLEIEVTYDDGTKERKSFPVDVWRNNELTFTAGFFGNKTVVEIVVDPDEAYADVDRANNVWKRPIT
ncbi:MAG: M1 family metallopeptidase, partial [Longimicrobiales bacterium]|nr:M1 family metallopeptidase [Longimicrobiales bacterium]